jgi:hypothetical protein
MAVAIAIDGPDRSGGVVRGDVASRAAELDQLAVLGAADVLDHRQMSEACNLRSEEQRRDRARAEASAQTASGATRPVHLAVAGHFRYVMSSTARLHLRSRRLAA